MRPTHSIREAQKKFPELVRHAEQGRFVRIKRRGKPVVLVISTKQLMGLIETAEILANPEAMKAIRDAKNGKGKTYPVSALAD